MLIFIEVPGKGDFIADFCFSFIDPGIGDMRLNFPFKVSMDIIFQRHYFRISQLRVGFDIAFRVKADISSFISFR